MVLEIAPVVRVDDKSTWIFRRTRQPVIFVRLQDFITDAFEFNSLFYQVVLSGGLHLYLEYGGIIVLSSIMRDDIIAHFAIKNYASAINFLQPDYFTTIDGETYEDNAAQAATELERCLVQSKELISLCHTTLPIGLVKGCNPEQIRKSVSRFKEMGIQDFVLHVGDFFRTSDRRQINIARGFAEVIRAEARTLILYGLGAPSLMPEFSFADLYVTSKHFIAATHGLGFYGAHQMAVGGFNEDLVVTNFMVLRNNLQKLKQQTKLLTGGAHTWVAVQEATEYLMHQKAIAIRRCQNTLHKATQE